MPQVSALLLPHDDQRRLVTCKYVLRELLVGAEPLLVTLSHCLVRSPQHLAGALIRVILLFTELLEARAIL
jgi:hypothetical protein